ncbi:hypothetical protein QBK93_07640 [Rhizobium leguminosarum]|uniref:hypothetical protein n=1 Tax=Rhizobium leguminosarum TaxID=384 RepID=UPI0024A8AB25|nr:hypothetical protein [Rhizobium leguminosarum]MDI5924552.1 hypothetical protein [Rhizobium leguminosarum]
MNRLAFWVAAALAFVAFESHAQDVVAERKAVADGLSSALLGGSVNFRELSENRGWTGVVLAPPGTSLAPIVEAFNGYPGDLSQALANENVFDRPVKVFEGLAVFDTRAIDAIWSDVITTSRPSAPLPRDRMLEVAVMKWLFKPIYKKGKVVGYTREPSRFLVRYKEFSNLYDQLQRGKTNDMWRLDPRLKKYSSFEEARSALIREWYKSGYKGEIEAATWSFEGSASGVVWQNWAAVSTGYQNRRRPIDFYRWLPETYLMPPPASWSSVSSWLRSGVRTTQGGQYTFQLARVKIERPWFDVDALTSKRLIMPISNGVNDLTLSDGTLPSFDRFPGGALSAFVSEIIIIRDIRYSGPPEATNTLHPLASFAYPDAINLIGYVVRVLPKLGTVPAPLLEPALGK